MTIDVSYEQFEDMWSDSPDVILDTNCFLEIHRKSTSDQEAILTILRGIQKSVWIPAQVKEEYMKNYRHVKKRRKKSIARLPNK